MTRLSHTSLGLALVLAFGAAACDEKEEPKPETTSTPSASASVEAKATAPGKVEAKPFDELVKESKPLEPEVKSVKLGTFDLKPERCKFEGEPPLDKSNTKVIQDLVVSGKKLYLVDAKGQLLGYDIDDAGGCTLKVDKTFGENGVLKLDKEIKKLSKDSKGNMVASHGIFESYYLEGGKHKYTCKARGQGYIEIAPDGKWGLGPFANATVNKITFEDSSCKSEPWALQDLGQAAKRKGPFSNVNSIGFMGNDVLVAGVIASEDKGKSPKQVAIMDASGKEKKRFGNEDAMKEDGFGWIHDVKPCKQGICVLDSNMRRVTAWDKTGKFLGSAKLSDAFGLKYPWLPAMSVEGDTVYFAAGQGRETKGVSEGMVYRVPGL